MNILVTPSINSDTDPRLCGCKIIEAASVTISHKITIDNKISVCPAAAGFTDENGCQYILLYDNIHDARQDFIKGIKDGLIQPSCACKGCIISPSCEDGNNSALKPIIADNLKKLIETITAKKLENMPQYNLKIIAGDSYDKLAEACGWDESFLAEWDNEAEKLINGITENTEFSHAVTDNRLPEFIENMYDRLL